MKKFTLLAAFACASFSAVFAQSACGNRDFEDSTFSGWNTFYGDNTAGLLLPMTWTPGTISTVFDASVTDPNARHTIITQNALDPIAVDPATMLPDTQMTTLAPNGGYITVRLGGTTPNYQAEKISWTYTVTPADTCFQYQYACVLNDGGHPYDQQPYMLVNFLDQSGNPIAGLCDTIYASDPNTPFITSGSDPSMKYRRWTPQSKNVGAYIGQSLTVEFVVSGCSQSGHFGYTYLDVSCFGACIPNVWPGDADYDLQANNADLLTLGLTYAATGTTRASASNSWTAQPSSDWPQHIALGANYKHSDCNGDGVINLDDTTALVNNYGMTHVYRHGASTTAPDVLSAAPQLYLVPVSDTVGSYNYAYVDIYVGSSALPVDNLYGLSFTINYDYSLVQPNTTFTDFNGSYLGVKNVSMLTLAHPNAAGENEIGMCRLTHTEMNGYGYLGRMRVSTVGVSAYTPIVYSLSNVHAINAMGATIPLSTAGTTIVIDPNLPAGMADAQADMHVNLFPNPANQQVTINTSMMTSSIVITDALGREILAVKPASLQTQIDVSAFAKGIYFVNIYSANGVTTKQLTIAE